MKTDLITFVILEILLISAFFVAFIKDFKIKKLEMAENQRKSKMQKTQNKLGLVRMELRVKAEVIRGEKSMNMLYVNFGIASIIFSLAVQTCEPLKGNQVLFIVINYAILIYLFFLSTWFRNAILFKLFTRFQRN
ncbi:hypothetical protein ABUL39_12255 [Rhodothermus marinus]|uniref:hypothetical protein n=1 Tax=Rhodothermus marinus TaxID=29549 RepID=UPI0037CC0C44